MDVYQGATVEEIGSICIIVGPFVGLEKYVECAQFVETNSVLEKIYAGLVSVFIIS